METEVPTSQATNFQLIRSFDSFEQLQVGVGQGLLSFPSARHLTPSTKERRE